MAALPVFSAVGINYEGRLASGRLPRLLESSGDHRGRRTVEPDGQKPFLPRNNISRSQSYNLLFHLARWWLVTAFTAWAMVSPPARCLESLRVKETQTGSRPVWATQSITAVASELAGNVSSARKLLTVLVLAGRRCWGGSCYLTPPSCRASTRSWCHSTNSSLLTAFSPFK